jgi:hypothetical protein
MELTISEERAPVSSNAFDGYQTRIHSYHECRILTPFLVHMMTLAEQIS